VTYEEIEAACREAESRLVAVGAPRNLCDRFATARMTVPVLRDLEEEKARRAGA